MVEESNKSELALRTEEPMSLIKKWYFLQLTYSTFRMFWQYLVRFWYAAIITIKNIRVLRFTSKTAFEKQDINLFP